MPYEYRSPEARVFRMPGYPALLAPIFLLFGPDASPMWGRALSAVLGGATASLVAWWGSLLFDMRTGMLAGWITAFYPGAVAMGSFVLSEAPFMPLMVAHLALAAAAFQAVTMRGGALLSIAAGCAAAGAVYVRPSWLLFVPFALVCGVLLSRKRLVVVAQSSIVAAMVCVCLAPWWIRNCRATSHFVPATLQVGISLKDGLNPNADGASDLERARNTVVDNKPVAETEWAQNQHYRDEAVHWARANPLRVLQLAGIKFVRMWNIIPNEPMFRSWPIKLGVAATFAPILILGCFGAWKYACLGWPYLLAILPAVYLTLLHMIFVASIRYREPAMLGLIVLAAAVIARWHGPQSDQGCSITDGAE